MLANLTIDSANCLFFPFILLISCSLFSRSRSLPILSHMRCNSPLSLKYLSKSCNALSLLIISSKLFLSIYLPYHYFTILSRLFLFLLFSLNLMKFVVMLGMKKKTAAEKTLTEIAKIALFEANAKTGLKKIQKILENLKKTC